MSRLALHKSNWTGNGWPSVEVAPYEYADFPKMLLAICAHFSVPTPHVTETLDGYFADLVIEGVAVTMSIDNWSCSVATERSDLRDRIHALLADLET